MRIGIGCDHAGFPLKLAVVLALKKFGYGVVDYGCAGPERTDYPLVAARVAQAVSKREIPKGILFCGTGIGMSIVANKFRGVRAAVAWSPRVARLAAEHNHANVLCFSGRFLPSSKVSGLLRAWLMAPMGRGRHARRVRQILRLERGPCAKPRRTVPKGSPVRMHRALSRAGTRDWRR